MSSIFWKKGSLIQRVGNHQEELGYIEFDSRTKTYVLWLKDPNEEEARYIRGDEFPSLAEAKDEAAELAAVWMFHYTWLSRLRREDKRPFDPANPSEPASDASAPVVQPPPLPEEVDGWLFKMTSGPQGSSLEVRVPTERLRRLWQWVKTWGWFGSS